MEEWHPTLQILRDIGTTISRPENRPSWVSASAPTGTQADQFFHAHYYQRTFDGRKANYAVFFERNQGRQQQAQPRRQEETCALGRANVQSRQTRQLMWVDRRRNAPWGEQSLSHPIHERHLVPAAHEFGVLLQVTPRPTDWRVIGNIPSSAEVWGFARAGRREEALAANMLSSRTMLGSVYALSETVAAARVASRSHSGCGLRHRKCHLQLT